MVYRRTRNDTVACSQCGKQFVIVVQVEPLRYSVDEENPETKFQTEKCPHCETENTYEVSVR